MIFIIGNELKVPVQIEHAMKIALVHDLAELKTDDSEVSPSPLATSTTIPRG